MSKTRALHTVSLCILLLAGSCVITDPEYPDEQDVTGYAPVYGSPASTEVAMIDARSIENPGKIYRYGKYLLVNEINKGIHVFDNTDPSDPVGLGFLQLLGNSDMAVKDGKLYADYMGNLIALSVNDFQTIEEKGRLPLKTWDLGLPPPAGFYFECVDPARGLVVSWESAELNNPECYAVQ